MGRRLFSREFKLETIRLVKGRVVSIVQASRDLDISENVPRRRIREFSSEHEQAFPGQGEVRPEQQEIDRLRPIQHIAKSVFAGASTGKITTVFTEMIKQVGVQTPPMPGQPNPLGSSSYG